MYSTCTRLSPIFSLLCHLKCNLSNETDQFENNQSKISQLLLIVYINLIQESRENFLKIARTSPMHGFLTSIRATIQLENLGN